MGADQNIDCWKPAAGEAGIRVRMYRVGFGDFFLISFLDGGGNPLHVIVDCGVFRGKDQTGDLHSIEAAVADMAKTTGGQVALIIMTHRHADHISGFSRCADVFRKLKVDAVWMPVWESEYEPLAVKFQAEVTGASLALCEHFSARGANATEAEAIARAYMENATGEEVPPGAAAAAGSGSNAKALHLLKHELPGVMPEYYKAGDKPQVPNALKKAGLECEILGPPPVTELDLMKLMDLQKNVGQYLALADAAAGPGTAWSPFEKDWDVPPPVEPEKAEREFYVPESFREWNDDRKSWGTITDEEAARGRLKMEADLQQMAPAAALTAAKQLNAFLNNQSLVVLFKFKGKSLLFVGDAQAGNWEHWLFNTGVADKKGSGELSIAARQILTSLDFYKVGHHGSGNATPKAAVQAMEKHDKFVSMCSTQADVYGNDDPDDPTKGTEVPRIPLLEKLASESALVRSDQIPITVNGMEIEAKAAAPLPGAPPGSRLEKGTLWVDCYL
jgi:beta-lactamase superfamily II metal-dependent hydrolase